MKSRKSLLSILIFALVLVLSVGYAVISYVDINIEGTASAAAEIMDVSFKSGSPVYDATTNPDVYTTVTNGSLTASITAKNLTLNNPVTLTYVVQNNETDVDASVIEHELTNSNTQYFDVSTDIETAKTCLQKGGTINVVVTVTLIKTPVNVDDNSTDIGITLRATPIDNNDNAS